MACALCLHRQSPSPDAAEFRHPVHRSRFPRPVADHRDYRHHLGGDLLRGRSTDGMAGVAHRHARTAVHPRAGDGLVRDAAVSRRGSLGIAGGAQQRIAQPALSFCHRRRFRRASVQHLFADRNHFCDFLLYLPFRVRPGRQRARQHARRVGGRLRDSRRQGLDHGAARHHSPGAAGAGRRRHDRVPAGDDAVRLAGDPGAAGRLPHHDHEDLEPVPVSAQARACRRRRGAAADPDHPVVAGAKVHPGAPRRVEMKGWRWAALAFCLVMLLNPVFLPYLALLNAAFSPNATTLVMPSTLTLHNIVFVFSELSSTQLALKNTVILGASTATIGTLLALVIAYVTTRQVIAGHRALGFLATAPVAVPGIVLGVGLFLSYTRPPFVLYGTLWILLIAFLTINLPSAYQQLQAAFTTIHPELEDASRILGATRLRSLLQITAPLLRTGVIATWCFIFIGVMRELSAAIVLFTSQTKVLSVLIYDLNESGDLAAISVLGIAMLVITFAVVFAVNRIPVFGANAGARLRN